MSELLSVRLGRVGTALADALLLSSALLPWLFDVKLVLSPMAVMWPIFLLLAQYRWQHLPVLSSIALHTTLNFVLPSELHGWQHVGLTVLRVMIALCGWAVSCASCLLFPVPGADATSGAYSVGGVRLVLVDHARAAWPQKPSACPGPRRLPVIIWYPAVRKQGFVEAAALPSLPYFTSPAKRAALATQFGMPSFLLRHFALVRTRTCIGAEPAAPKAEDGKGPGDGFPLVIFSHSWTGCREQNSLLMEELASHGFVVAACDHVGDSPLSEFVTDADEGVHQVGQEAGVGILAYQGHPNFMAWSNSAHAALHEAGDVLANEADADARHMRRLYQAAATTLRSLEKTERGGLGWDAAVAKHGTSNVATALIELQAYRSFQLKHRADDVSFIADALTALHATGKLPTHDAPPGQPQTPKAAALRQLAPYLDPSCMYAIGQSFGGGTAAYACTVDDRFTGCFGLDPWMWTLPGGSPSLQAMLGSSDVAQKTIAEAEAAQPARPSTSSADAKNRKSSAEQPKPLRCPALFLSMGESWVPERCTRDAYGLDQRTDLTNLCCRGIADSDVEGQPITTQAWLEGGFHFDVTDIPTWAPRVSSLLVKLTSPIHLTAGRHALQKAMTEAFLAFHASAPRAKALMQACAGSDQQQQRSGKASRKQFAALQTEQTETVTDAITRAAPGLFFTFGDRKPTIQPQFATPAQTHVEDDKLPLRKAPARRATSATRSTLRTAP